MFACADSGLISVPWWRGPDMQSLAQGLNRRKPWFHWLASITTQCVRLLVRQQSASANEESSRPKHGDSAAVARPFFALAILRSR